MSSGLIMGCTLDPSSANQGLSERLGTGAEQKELNISLRATEEGAVLVLPEATSHTSGPQQWEPSWVAIFSERRTQLAGVRGENREMTPGI